MKIDINEKERMALDCVKDIIKDHVKLLNEQTDINSHVEGILDLGNIYYTISGIIEKYEKKYYFQPPKIEDIDPLKHQIFCNKKNPNNQNIVSKEPNQAPTDHILTLAEQEKEKDEDEEYPFRPFLKSLGYKPKAKEPISKEEKIKKEISQDVIRQIGQERKEALENAWKGVNKEMNTPIIDNGIYFSDEQHNEQKVSSKDEKSNLTDNALSITEQEKELHQRAIEELERLTNGEKHQYKYTFVRSNIGRTED